MSGENMPDFQAVIDSPIPGVPSLGLRFVRGRLSEIGFLYRRRAILIEADARAVAEVLGAYWRREQPCGESITLQPQGTPFQQAVWAELGRIPYGTVVTYGELADRLGSSARAVAGACRANPVPLLVPCHRVVAANDLGGYLGESAGRALTIKRWLLQHEGYL